MEIEVSKDEMTMPPLTPTQQIINEQRQARILAQAIREAR
jgi:hypothetical protein